VVLDEAAECHDDADKIFDPAWEGSRMGDHRDADAGGKFAARALPSACAMPEAILKGVKASAFPNFDLQDVVRSPAGPGSSRPMRARKRKS